jgi:ribosome recycling factor
MRGAVSTFPILISELKMAQATMAAIPGLKETYVQLKTRMDKAVDDFRKAMAATRTGRASVHMLDSVTVDYYGSQMPLNQIAQVHASEAQLLTVQPFDPTSLPAIEKAIRTAELGLNPMNDGKIIRVPVPPLTEERRKDMVKHLNKVLEEHRTAVRNIRRDGNDAIKKAMKDKKITEDDEKRAMEEIQKLTDDEIRKMEELNKNKEKELMEV